MKKLYYRTMMTHESHIVLRERTASAEINNSSCEKNCIVMIAAAIESSFLKSQNLSRKKLALYPHFIMSRLFSRLLSNQNNHYR